MLSLLVLKRLVTDIARPEEQRDLLDEEEEDEEEDDQDADDDIVNMDEENQGGHCEGGGRAREDLLGRQAQWIILVYSVQMV